MLVQSPSCQNGVVHLLRGVGLAGQLLQRPAVTLVQHLQAGRVQDPREGLWGDATRRQSETGLPVSPTKDKTSGNLRVRTPESVEENQGNQPRSPVARKGSVQCYEGCLAEGTE